MVTGTERVQLLRAAAADLDGISPRDLEIMGHLEVRSRAMAGQILWDNRRVMMAAFEDLVAAMPQGNSSSAAHEPEDAVPPGTATQEAQLHVEPVLDLTPAGRFRRLLDWRAGHSDPGVARLSDQDLGRLAASRVSDRAGIESIAPQFSAGHLVVTHAAELSTALTGRPAEVDEAGDAEPFVAEEPELEPLPQPVPSPEPALLPEPVGDGHAVVDFQWEPAVRFAHRDMMAGPAQPCGFVAAQDDDRGVRIEWTPVREEAPVTLYRVVSSTTTWPTGSPELGSLVGVTRGTRGHLELRPAGPVTYLAVWVNQGESLVEATQSQPRLVGVSEIVWPPSGLTAQTTPSRTVAALLSAPEQSRIEVQRFLKGMPVAYDINRELDRDFVSATGFQDLNPPMGEDLVYAAFSVAELADGKLSVSRPVTAEVHLTPDVQQVTVQVVSRDDGSYDLTWQAPRHGQVRVYALQERPQVGLEKTPLKAEVVENQGLTSSSRIHNPPQDLGGGLMNISGYVVDPRWVRVHFVAVHWVSENSVWVGPTISKVTPRPPAHVEVVERVDAQIITFAWPTGVTVVQAFTGPRGQSVDPSRSDPVGHLTEKQYVQTGGMRVTQTLPSRGCSIHLHGVVYLDGRPVYSEPATVDYPGITRLWYRIIPSQAAVGGAPMRHRIEARADVDLHDTPLVLVGRPDRIPLHPQDGRILMQEAPVSLSAGVPTVLGEVPAGLERLFVRLFVHRPPAECGSVAVLDPAVSNLNVNV